MRCVRLVEGNLVKNICRRQQTKVEVSKGVALMMTSAHVVETSVNVSDSNLLQTVLTRAIASLNNGRWSWVQVVGSGCGCGYKPCR